MRKANSDISPSTTSRTSTGSYNKSSGKTSRTSTRSSNKSSNKLSKDIFGSPKSPKSSNNNELDREIPHSRRKRGQQRKVSKQYKDIYDNLSDDQFDNELGAQQTNVERKLVFDNDQPTISKKNRKNVGKDDAAATSRSRRASSTTSNNRRTTTNSGRQVDNNIYRVSKSNNNQTNNNSDISDDEDDTNQRNNNRRNNNSDISDNEDDTNQRNNNRRNNNSDISDDEDDINQRNNNRRNNNSDISDDEDDINQRNNNRRNNNSDISDDEDDINQRNNNRMNNNSDISDEDVNILNSNQNNNNDISDDDNTNHKNTNRINTNPRNNNSNISDDDDDNNHRNINPQNNNQTNTNQRNANQRNTNQPNNNQRNTTQTNNNQINTNQTNNNQRNANQRNTNQPNNNQRNTTQTNNNQRNKPQTINNQRNNNKFTIMIFSWNASGLKICETINQRNINQTNSKTTKINTISTNNCITPDFFEEIRNAIKQTSPELVVMVTENEDTKGSYFHSDFLPNTMKEISLANSGGYTLLKANTLDDVGITDFGNDDIITGSPSGSSLRMSIYAQSDIIDDVYIEEKSLSDIFKKYKGIAAMKTEILGKAIGMIITQVVHKLYGKFIFIGLHLSALDDNQQDHTFDDYATDRANTILTNNLILLRVLDGLKTSNNTNVASSSSKNTSNSRSRSGSDNRSSNNQKPMPEHIFLMGDMNFDISVPNKSPQDVITELANNLTSNKIRELLKYDELYISKAHLPLRDYIEGVDNVGPLFMPDWKLTRGRADSCDTDEKVTKIDISCFDVTNEYGSVGWHSRILYKDSEQSNWITKCTSYNRLDIGNMKYSNHAGVVGFYDIVQQSS